MNGSSNVKMEKSVMVCMSIAIALMRVYISNYSDFDLYNIIYNVYYIISVLRCMEGFDIYTHHKVYYCMCGLISW